MKVSNITIGADPEFFIKSKKDGKFISSIGIIPGVKKGAVPMEGLPKGFASQIDNVLGEYNIPPVKSKEEFSNSIKDALNWFNKFLENKELEVHCAASARYNEDQLASDEAKEIGCDPSLNCWTEQLQERPEVFAGNLRTAGTHIHIGYEDRNIDTNYDLMCACDMFLGVPSILIDTDTERREYYGKAGDFRHTKYGCEYRVLSGLFTKSKELTDWCYDQTMQAIDYVNSGKTFVNEQELGQRVQNIINNNDTADALAFCKEYNINLPESYKLAV